MKNYKLFFIYILGQKRHSEYCLVEEWQWQTSFFSRDSLHQGTNLQWGKLWGVASHFCSLKIHGYLLALAQNNFYTCLLESKGTTTKGSDITSGSTPIPSSSLGSLAFLVSLLWQYSPSKKCSTFLSEMVRVPWGKTASLGGGCIMWAWCSPAI